MDALVPGRATVTYEVVSVLCGGGGPDTGIVPVRSIDNRSNKLSPCRAYQQVLVDSDSEFVVYVHDDVTIHDQDWLDKLLAPFVMADVVATGLGGAMSLGAPSLYKRAYNIWDMARAGYMSNQTDWQTHGSHETGMRRVAVLDAFCMAVRTNWLREIGGWPVEHLTHHCLDLWLACEAARAGKQTWMVGTSCTHHGGGTSTKPVYAQAAWMHGGMMSEDHERPHRWLYEQYRDVLPIVVGGREEGRASI